MPFDVCGAMSQGYIGYHIQQALKQKLKENNMDLPVATIAGVRAVLNDTDWSLEFEDASLNVGFLSEEEGAHIAARPCGQEWRRRIGGIDLYSVEQPPKSTRMVFITRTS